VTALEPTTSSTAEGIEMADAVADVDLTPNVVATPANPADYWSLLDLAGTQRADGSAHCPGFRCVHPLIEEGWRFVMGGVAVRL
jgi:hypothetical protein